MEYGKRPILRKVIAALAVFAIISAIPSSFADEIIKTLTGDSTDSVAVQDESAPGDPSIEQPDAAPEASPTPTEPANQDSITVQNSKETVTASASPSPTPPHALANQSMRIISPTEINVDPRARSVYLPRINVAASGNLLICASSNLGSFDANVSNTPTGDGKSELNIFGAATPNFRISGVGNQAAEIINSGNGLRVFAPNKALAGTFIQLKFVALSEASSNSKLCNDAIASNTRTIFFRGLGMDLNIIKGGVTLK